LYGAFSAFGLPGGKKFSWVAKVSAGDKFTIRNEVEEAAYRRGGPIR
jgi:hypothetical protein